MRTPSEVQSKSIERILAEFETANLAVTENFVSLVQGSPTEDIFGLFEPKKVLKFMSMKSARQTFEGR